MKIKNFSALFLSLCIAYSARCQQFTYDFSKGKYDDLKFYGDGVPAKAGRIILKTKLKYKFGLDNTVIGVTPIILLVNEKMEIVKETELVLKNSRFVNIKGLFQIGGKTILVYSYKNDKSDTEYKIIGLTINDADMSPGQEVEFGKFQTSEGLVLPNFEFITSSDSSKYLLFVERDSQKKDEMKQFSFNIFNRELARLCEKNIELPVENRHVVIQSKTIDNKGNLYIEIKKFEKEVKDVRDNEYTISPYATVLIHYTPNGNKENEIELSIIGKYLHNSLIFFNEKTKKTAIAGTYKVDANGKVAGAFYCNYDPTLKTISDLKFSEIPNDILDIFDKEGIASIGGKKPGISGNFDAKKLTNRNNGTLDYTLEYNSSALLNTTYTSAVSGSNVYTPYYKYYSNSILNINIDTDGKMVFTRIPKSQNDDGAATFISYYSFYKENKLVFLYNDDKSNNERDVNKIPDPIKGIGKKSVLMAAIIDERGNLTRKIVYDHSDDKYVTNTERLKIISPNRVFCIKSTASNHSKFGIIELN